MSFEAITWALNIEGLVDATSRVIILGLASHAKKDGTAAWPSVKTLSEYAVCSERTVHRRLRDLEASGYIVRGDQQLVSHIPSGRRPVVWDLPVGIAIWQAGRGDNLSGVSPEAERGDTGVMAGVTPMADKSSITPNGVKPSIEPSSQIDAPGSRDDVETVCSAVADHVAQITGRRPKITKTWRRDTRLMLDRDDRTVEACLDAIRWVGASDFWASVILSPQKLRAKWDTIEGQARRRGTSRLSATALSTAALADSHARLFPEDAR